VERFISKSGHLERGNTGNEHGSSEELTILIELTTTSSRAEESIAL